jgi:glycosyltransferase involved in cell wall biosynthesis
MQEMTLTKDDGVAFLRSPADPRGALGMPDWSNESMTTPLLSIGLFLYNGERFLEAAIDSILNQTFRDFELILSDNCSSDRSGEICRRFAAQDSRIRYYRAERNMGAGWNLRNVYFKATGKYFKWATHDGMIQPDFLRLCIDALEADDSLVVAHSLTRCIDEDGQFIESNDERLRTSSLNPVVRARDLLLKGHEGYPFSGLIRLDALRKLPPRGGYVHSDRVLLLQLGLLGRFYEVPEHLSISTRHTGQASWTMPERNRVGGFRLTWRWGTLPSPEWWDPAKARELTFPEWNAAKEFARSVTCSSLRRGQRLKCYSMIARWAWNYRRRFARDLVVAADQLLFNLQNRHDTGAKHRILVSLDLDPRGGGESV